MNKYKTINKNYIYLIISSISIVIFNLNFSIYNDDFWWLDYCSKSFNTTDFTDNRIIYDSLICLLFNKLNYKIFLYRIFIIILLIISCFLILKLIRNFNILFLNKKSDKNLDIFIISLFLIFPGMPSITAWGSSIVPISFFCLYIFSTNLIFNINSRDTIIYFIIQTVLALQYEIYAGLILTNIFIFYFLYKKKLLLKKNFQKIIITKLIIFFLVFLIILNVSNKNIEFVFNYENIYKILLLDIYYLINSFILTFNYFSIIILLLSLFLITKFKSIIPILKKKYFIFYFLSIIITIAIYNLGGYPISFSGLNGRVFLIPALYFVFIFYFILNFLNLKNRKNFKFLLYTFILFGYLNSSYYFYELSKNQKKSFDKISKFISLNRSTKNIFLFTDLKTSFYEINLSSYINQLHNLNLENVYIYNLNERCIIIKGENISIYSKKSNFKKFISKKKDNLNFKLQTIKMETPTIVIKEKKFNKKNFNNCES